MLQKLDDYHEKHTWLAPLTAAVIVVVVYFLGAHIVGLS